MIADADFATAVLRELAQINRRLDRVLGSQEPDMTQADFAKRANLSVKTIHRRIQQKRIITRNGRIPASELSKVVS